MASSGDSIDDLVVAGYDAVFTAMPEAPLLRQIWRERACGLEYPEEFGHISFLTLDDIGRMAADVMVGPDGCLADLACGMGGPGLWVAQETGARLVGIDVSPVAVGQASARASALGLGDRATFAVGTFAATGLDSASVDAAMSIDALQYAPDKGAAAEEVARIVRPGGRFAFTAFEVDAERAADLPVIGVDPVGDFRPLLEGAGFTVISYDEVPDWESRLTSTYEAVLAAADALSEEMGQIAFAAFAMEVSITLQSRPYRRRVSAVVTRH